ncbi:dephospho-CoA kinase [Candidatus Purcelliella pentastirinorum]|uniref:Dephospho-CoA kinase n=1 Tax=Candidatus Purcelliella pentastirinorum TaxID=472834 RepID=A0AAX3N884_9ENTR|nr:dephospho-CoA kinase [Candidatus Purcelliella pentastirinorum]WDI78656.1 dephospho-CoA kinase [Candidatus Purcelliella pentastirinorum]WDR80317.1 dephospho-CoA kinase [Candidatus Purcelliella pentastirinorum]
MNYIVTLTGGIGCGKTTATNIFKKLKIDIIDSDEICKKITKPGKPALKTIISKFGTYYLTKEGLLNKKKIKEKIFKNPKCRIWLNNFLHPMIHKEAKKQILKSKSLWCLWIIPLLLNTNIKKNTNRILVIDVSENIQIKRTMLRDNNNYYQTKNIISTQDDRNKRLNLADDIIKNEGSIKKLKKKY